MSIKITNIVTVSVTYDINEQKLSVYTKGKPVMILNCKGTNENLISAFKRYVDEFVCIESE